MEISVGKLPAGLPRKETERLMCSEWERARGERPLPPSSEGLVGFARQGLLFFYFNDNVSELVGYFEPVEERIVSR